MGLVDLELYLLKYLLADYRTLSPALTVQMHLEGGKIVDKASVNVVFA